MKIAIPVDETTMETSVCPSFGRAPAFLIFDSDSDQCEFLANSASDSQGGAGIKAAQLVADQKVDALLTPRCGENAAEVLHAAGIQLYKTTAGTAMENIRAHLEGKLPPLLELHKGFHGHGG